MHDVENERRIRRPMERMGEFDYEVIRRKAGNMVDVKISNLLMALKRVNNEEGGKKYTNYS